MANTPPTPDAAKASPYAWYVLSLLWSSMTALPAFARTGLVLGLAAILGAYRLLPAAEASKLARARAAGEAI